MATVEEHPKKDENKEGREKEEASVATQTFLNTVSYSDLDDGLYALRDPSRQPRQRSSKSINYKSSSRSDHSALISAVQEFLPSETEKRSRKGLEPEKYGMFSRHAEPEEERSGTMDSLLQPSSIEALEGILSNHYNKQAIVTNIKSLPITRKHIKEVRFTLGDYLSKVWVFKADPKTTAKEMIAYEVAFKHKIPTGEPIGFLPKYDQTYPYDIAIIGGVVEHSREDFKSVIEALRLRPALVYDTAEVIADLIVKYQSELTRNRKELDDRGVGLTPFVPDEPLEERFFRGLGFPQGKTDAGLVGEALELYVKQKGGFVVSQNDLNPGNIIPLAQLNGATGQVDTHLGQFGIIDWGLICLDNAFADPVDFWVYLDRLAGRHRELDFGRFIESYASEAPSALGIKDSTDAYIQLALRQLYKIADPIRTDAKDASRKMRHHYGRAREAFALLEKQGIPVGSLAKRVADIVEPRL